MKRLLFITMAFAFLIPFTSFAQDERLDEYSFETAPIQEEESPYFALGLGYTGSLQFPKLDLINTTIKDRFGLDKFNSVVWYNSVEGFTSLVFIPNMRLGFLGSGGGIKSQKKDTVTGFTKTVEFETGLTGIALDYSFVPFKNFAVTAGSELGWGELRLLAYQTDGDARWTDDMTPSTDANNYYKRGSRSILYARPRINAEFALTSVILLRLGAGYTYAFGSPTWEFNNLTALKGVPKEINFNGPSLQIGLFFELFNY